MSKQKKHQFSELEEKLIKVWEKEQTFAASLKNREGKKRFSFFDGPPYANGAPHHGHVVPVSIKDALTRYKTMRGYYVPRVLGWDTHGLPVEYQIEKELGFKTKRDIEEYGIAKFNQANRDSVFRYKAEWEKFFERIGRWADADNAYATLEDSYIESIWWVFAEVYKKDLIHRGFRSMPYCYRCGTPLSNFELNQGYKDEIRDPSLYVKFRLLNWPDGPEQADATQVHLVAWTTTPWTLPGNAALGVDPAAEYVRISYVNDDDKVEHLVLAKERLEIIDGDYKVEEQFRGKQLIGKQYEPLFEVDLKKLNVDDDKNLYKVWEADFVSLEDGTGIVHIAPAFGEDDLALGQANDISLLQTVDEVGNIKENIIPGAHAHNFKDADKHLIEHLTKEGKVFAAETIEHTYPFCWRCDSPLMYYAVETWFMDVPKIKDKLLANNDQIEWVPSHIKEGRFGNWLAEAREWGISRNRYWGAPMPVWQCGQGHYTVIGSIAELEQKAATKPKEIDMHRPGIDKVEITCDECGEPASRIEEVFDVWFESGCMPYAHVHYPFENKNEFTEIFPADFIAESIDQTRGWFYTLLVLAAALFDKPPSKNIVVSGWVVAADGEKLSKRLKNYVPLDAVFDEYGADVLRFFMLTSPVTAAEDVRFESSALRDIQRNVFMTLWNVHKFLATYRDIQGWSPAKKLSEPKSDNVLDQWMLSRLYQTTYEMTKQADSYQVAKATRPLIDLIDDLSNWYVRRSRKRFRSDDKVDEQSAFATLHYVLVRLTQLMAPWAPFMSDAIYREITAGMDMPASVHLTDWPPHEFYVDEHLLGQMEELRSIVTLGLKQRADKGIKVRQPLQKTFVNKYIFSADPLQYEDIQAVAKSHGEEESRTDEEALEEASEELMKDFAAVIKEELNVKEVIYDSVKNRIVDDNKNRIVVDTNLTSELKREGLVRDLIRHIQQYRKEEGLKVGEPINLSIQSQSEEINQAVDEHLATIKAETQAEKIDSKPPASGKTVKVGEHEVVIAFKRA